jgi:RHS repeat-associated protein
LWVQQDANWNVTALINGSGSVVERYDYDPYGKQTVLDASFNTRSSSSYAFIHGFQGLRLDTTSGLYYARNRDLSPTLGRWTQADPLGFGGGDTNFYRAEGNGTPGRQDPSGLTWIMPEEVFDGPINDNLAISMSPFNPDVPLIPEGPEKPGFWHSMVPVEGSIVMANYHMHRGELGWYAFYCVMTGVDAVGVGAIGKGLVKGGIKLLGRGGTEQVVKGGAEAATTSLAKGGTQALCKKGAELVAKRVFVIRFMKGGTAGSRFHAFFRLGSKIYHYNGKLFREIFNLEEVTGAMLRYFRMSEWSVKIPLWVLSPGKALSNPKSWTCITGALSAFNRGNYYIPGWLLLHMIRLFDNEEGEK